MRSIGTISDETRARRFGDFLTSQGIDTNVEPAAGGFQIWVLDDDKLQAAAADLTAFQAAPDDPRFAATAGAALSSPAAYTAMPPSSPSSSSS